MDIEGYLTDLFKEKTSGAFLFLGSGFSRRYIGLEDWKGLLQRFCAPGKKFEYYLSRVDGDYPEAAKLLSVDFNERWWSDPEFEESRAHYGQSVSTSSSALRVEICRYLSSLTDKFPDGVLLGEEVEIVRRLNVDGVITTNWDCFAEHLFPDYKVYVGQGDLLFANPQEVGEIYKIHGGCSDPESLVLTSDDYALFASRNPYLAAKLITVFVEHPVVFIGYSLSDPNIQSILRSISSCIGSKNVSKLRKNLIFLQRPEEEEGDSISESYYALDAEQIPIVLVKTQDFSKVYAALEKTKRKVPARILRFCKDQMYEIVKGGDPDKKISVIDIENITKTDDVEFLVGVGVIAKGLSAVGYESIQLVDLLSDLVIQDRQYSADMILKSVIKSVGRNTNNVPVFKYLNAAGITSKADFNKSEYDLKKWVERRIDEFRSNVYKKSFAKKCKDMDIQGVIDEFTPEVAAAYIPFLSADKIDLEVLRGFLEDNFDIFKAGSTGYVSYYRKLACFYDRLRWGWRF
ncbi:SIR2 family protein [Stenotrophomonas maltophilia]|uniref:SIR2 family protein n=1 Tax=Stenotrophomonas maltophilia TaxID=40324 RepID=UPI000C144D48|nr:SIR2 family protein [Stenotrophomonas maltophilia]MCM2520726.1 SIR2 family protein [Stenotrophomonas maltophilia]HDX0800798.1 SIR2 family protein [Stenotrophomonas maltophilia]HDX0813636.1 SIR2 family protein [Stenotrophomonas maltophilia]HDX0825052.1 SIR2 family protein [Stenotrophomonas maltophilia]HDX0841725.1 SIR2 family protein [Stenotrophomonas maltophilia]